MTTHCMIPRNTLLGAGLLLAIGTAFSAAPPLRPAPQMTVEVGATSLDRGVTEVAPSEFGDAWFRFVQASGARQLTWHSNGAALVRIDPETRTPDLVVSTHGDELTPLNGLRRSDLVSDGRWFAFDYESVGPEGPRKSTRHTDGNAHIDVHHD